MNLLVASDPDQLSGAESTAWLIFVVLLHVAVVLYLLPTLLAAIRHVSNVGTIAVINIFLGWSFYGWVFALALACQHVDKRPRPERPREVSTIVHWPQPGWYPDPWTPHEQPVAARLRYFDGNAWALTTASASRAG
jgi:hypothetical protein